MNHIEPEAGLHSGSALKPQSYLSYNLPGGEDELNLSLCLELLDECLSGENRLSESRKRDSFAGKRTSGALVRYCDVCGLPMTISHSETMSDGRIRCQECALEEVLKQDELQNIYEACKTNFQAWFGPLPEGLEIRQSALKNSAVLERRTGRVLFDQGHYVIETASGASRLAVIYALVCSFALIWTLVNWDQKRLKQICQAASGKNPDPVYPALIGGMRLWAGVEYLYQIGESHHAAKIDSLLMSESEPEAAAYALFKKTYPLRTNRRLALRHPFSPRIPVDVKALAFAIDPKSAGKGSVQAG